MFGIMVFVDPAEHRPESLEQSNGGVLLGAPTDSGGGVYADPFSMIFSDCPYTNQFRTNHQPAVETTPRPNHPAL